MWNQTDERTVIHDFLCSDCSILTQGETPRRSSGANATPLHATFSQLQLAASPNAAASRRLLYQVKADARCDSPAGLRPQTVCLATGVRSWSLRLPATPTPGRGRRKSTGNVPRLLLLHQIRVRLRLGFTLVLSSKRGPAPLS